MNSLSMQPTTLSENGVVSTMNRRETSDSNGAQASTFEAQFNAFHKDASAEKAQAPSHDKVRGNESGDKQASDRQGSPRPIVESLTLLQLSRLQKASQNGQPAKKEKSDESAAPEATGEGAANWPMSALGPDQVSALFAAFEKTSAIPGDANAPSNSDATRPNVGATDPTTSDSLAAFFAAAPAQIMSDKTSFPTLSPAAADPAEAASNTGGLPKLDPLDSANASLTQALSTLGASATAPKRVTLENFLAHLPADLAQALSEKPAPTQGVEAEGVSRADASNQLLSASATMEANASAMPSKLTVVSFATHLPAMQTPILTLEGAPAGNANSMDAPPFSQMNSGVDDSTEKSVSTAANDAFGQQLELQGVAATPLSVGSPSSGGSSQPGSVSQTSSSASTREISNHAKDGPAKILTFQLEPEDLGAVTVRMQLTKTRVSLKIDVDSPAVQNLLTQSKDQLSQALSASGHSVDDIAIRVSPAPAPSDTVNDARQNDSQAPFDQRGDGGSFGANDGTGNNRDGQSFSRAPRKDQSQEHGRVASDRGAPGASGVYL